MSLNTSTTTKNILITGTSRGLGLELVRQFLENESNIHIYATARNIEHAKELQKLAQKYSNLSLLEVDISSQSSIQSSFQSLPPISLLINNAGINHVSGTDINSQETFVFEDVYRTNSIGPAIVINTVLPALKEAVKLNLRPIVINISSTLGSCTNTSSFPGLLPYRMSKAALNMLTTFYAAQHKDITFLSVCPGWCATDLGKIGGSSPPLTPQFSVSALRKLIDNVTPEQSGQFLDRNGKIEW